MPQRLGILHLHSDHPGDCLKEGAAEGAVKGSSCGSTPIPGVSKGCFLEVFKYSRASKTHGTFVTPG